MSDQPSPVRASAQAHAVDAAYADCMQNLTPAEAKAWNEHDYSVRWKWRAILLALDAAAEARGRQQAEQALVHARVFLEEQCEIAEQLLADGWSAAFECPGFEPLDLSGLTLPHAESDTCRHCHEARWHHQVATLCRRLGPGHSNYQQVTGDVDKIVSESCVDVRLARVQQTEQARDEETAKADAWVTEARDAEKRMLGKLEEKTAKCAELQRKVDFLTNEVQKNGPLALDLMAERACAEQKEIARREAQARFLTERQRLIDAEERAAALTQALKDIDAMNKHFGAGPHCTCSQRAREDAVRAALTGAQA